MLKSPTWPDLPPVKTWQSSAENIRNKWFDNFDALTFGLTSLPGFRLMWSAVAAFLRLASKMNMVWHAVWTIDASAVISTKMVSFRIVKWPPITVNVLYKNSPVCAPTSRMSSNWKLRNESYCKCRTWTMPISVAIVAENEINNSNSVVFFLSWKSAPNLFHRGWVRKSWLRLRPASRIRVEKSARKIESTKWWSTQEWECQRKGLCERGHNPLNSNAAIACMVTFLRWHVRLALDAADKCRATSHTKWQHKSASIRWCTGTGTVTRPEPECRWYSFDDTRICDAVLWVHEQSVHGLLLYLHGTMNGTYAVPIYFPIDAIYVAFDFLDRRMWEFRVSSLESRRSTKPTDSCRSCASNQNGRWFCGDTLSFAAKKWKFIYHSSFWGWNWSQWTHLVV